MTLDDTQPTERRLQEDAEGVDSAPHAEVRRQGSFGDVELPDEDVEVKTELEGSYGQVDRTPGTAGDEPHAGMVDAAATGSEGSFGDVDDGRVDATEKGSYGELDRPEGLERAEEETQRYNRNG